MGQTDAGGERRRALREERASAGRRGAAHAAPAAPDGAIDPFTTPASGTEAVRAGAGTPLTQPFPTPAPAPQPVSPTPPLGTPLPSRRDRAALRRPTALDEAAVQAADAAAWRTSPALEDPRTASAISRPSPLTHALARTLTEHLDSLTPPTGLSTGLATGGAGAGAPVYVPRRRSAPAVSGPLPVVGTTTTEPRREPSWTTEPVSSRRASRPSADPLPGADELPPPPPAAEVEAAVRARAARLSTAPVPPPMPDRVVPDPSRRSSVVVPTSGLPTAAPRSGVSPLSGISPLSSNPVSGPTAGLTAADLAALRTAAASTTGAPATAATATTPTPTSTSPLSTPPRGDARHGRTRPTGRATGRAGARPASGSARSAAASSRPAAAGRGQAGPDRRWHQRRALGVPVGLLTAAVALAAAVVVGVASGAADPSTFAPNLTSASGGAAPDGATPPAATPTGDPAASQGEQAAAEEGQTAAAAEGDASAGAAAPAAAPAESTGQPAASASAPASPVQGAAAIPTGDVTYEGFGTAKDTYVELGTKDARDVREDLGSTFSQPMAGSKDWPGWYVAVYSYDGPGKGSVGCRIKDADGRVLAEETSADGQLVMCTLGKPAGVG